MIEFWVGEMGLESRIAEIRTPEKYWGEDTPPNMQWYCVRVKSEQDKSRWIQLRDTVLACCWTPNQSDAEKQESAEIEKACLAEMALLEVK